MKHLEKMEALYKSETYSSKQGHKRKPQKIQPTIQYEVNSNPLTDKDVEFVLIQNKQMKEFIFRMGINEDFNEFVGTKVMSGELPAWFRKWN